MIIHGRTSLIFNGSNFQHRSLYSQSEKKHAGRQQLSDVGIPVAVNDAFKSFGK